MGLFLSMIEARINHFLTHHHALIPETTWQQLSGRCLEIALVPAKHQPVGAIKIWLLANQNQVKASLKPIAKPDVSIHLSPQAMRYLLTGATDKAFTHMMIHGDLLLAKSWQQWLETLKSPSYLPTPLLALLKPILQSWSHTVSQSIADRQQDIGLFLTADRQWLAHRTSYLQQRDDIEHLIDTVARMKARLDRLSL